MKQLQFPYGKEFLPLDVPEHQLQAVLISGLHGYDPGKDGETLVQEAMATPIGTKSLRELAQGKERVVLIATGCHRKTTLAELEAKFGPEIVKNEKIVVHDCDDEENLVTMGTLPSGGTLKINRLAAKSDDGHGGEGFYRQLAGEPDIAKTMALFLARGREETEADQWQTQIFLRVLQKSRVIYVSDAPDEMVRTMHMTPAHSLSEALSMAETMVNNPDATVTAIPDGVAVMVCQ